MKNYKMKRPASTTGMAVIVPFSAGQEMSGVNAQNATNIDILTHPTPLPKNEHHEHLPYPLEWEHDVLNPPHPLQPQLF